MVHGDWLARWARYAPDKVAVVELSTGRRATYAALNDRADRAARALATRYGVGAGDRVAVLGENRVEQLETYFALAKLGAVLVPVNWRLAADEVAYVLGHSEPKLLVHGAEVAGTVGALSGVGWSGPLLAYDEAGTGPSWEGLVAETPAGPVATESVSEQTPAMLLYTSGTTGRPKGAVLTHGTITWNAINTAAGWDLGHDDVTITHTPLFHTGGWNVLTLPLLHRGATVVMARRFDPAETLEAVSAHGLTILFAVPTMFQMMLEHEGFAGADLSSLRFLISGGAPCPLPLIEAYAARGLVFKQGYGLTEVGPNCFVLHERDAIRKAGSVGFPILHLDARLVDGGGREVGPGEVGELRLRGPTVCAGYFRDPEATARAIDEGGWFATGDLFRRDEEGYHYVVGRLKEMFISGGENVYPAEVERVLYEVREVAEAAVIGVGDPRWGEVGHAFVAFAGGALGPDPQAILELARSRLARFKVPKKVTVLESLPKNAAGKIDKLALRRHAEAARPEEGRP